MVTLATPHHQPAPVPTPSTVLACRALREALSHTPTTLCSTSLTLQTRKTYLLALFVFYLVLRFFRDRGRNDSIIGNIRVNNTGKSSIPSCIPFSPSSYRTIFQLPDRIDRDTPKEAQSRVGFDGNEYELVFSDEFNQDGRTFYPGDDPFWEASELWYGQTEDL
jgi:hypothetical protein